jgi:hypothetical protein
MYPYHNRIRQRINNGELVGIEESEYAYDEKKRIESMLKTPNMRSILYENKIVEAQTFDICRPYGLLSPTYDTKTRDGCWFCPNQSIEQMAKFAKEYPQYWALLEELAEDKEMANENFRFGQTFAEVNAEIKEINSRITLFDFMESDNEKQGN